MNMTERGKASTYVYDDFIEELQDIASEHNWHDAPVNLSSQCNQIDACGLDTGICMVVEILEGVVQIIAALALRADGCGFRGGGICFGTGRGGLFVYGLLLLIDRIRGGGHCVSGAERRDGNSSTEELEINDKDNNRNSLLGR